MMMPESYSKSNGDVVCEGCFKKEQTKLDTTHKANSTNR